MANHAAPPADAGARRLAWEILQQVEAGGYADALLGHRLRRSDLMRRDQSLATQLVYVTLAWQGYLDHLLAAFSRTPLERLDPPVRVLLRLGLAQVVVLTRIPPFAAVNTAVELAKQFRGGAAVSLVNAVLRRAVGGWRSVPLPSRHDDPVGYLSTRLSHPAWLVARWIDELGIAETEQLLHANNDVAPTVLRVNRGRIDRDALVRRLQDTGVAATPTAYSPVGIRVEAAGPPESIPGYRDGLFSIQGEASQLVGFLVAPQPAEYVLDACAAPGGKATHLAELMGERGTVIAVDTHARGIGRVQQIAQRLGLGTVRTLVGDATTWHPRAGTARFDRVLVDAPCSGLGTLRAHPEIRWRRTADDVTALARLQGELLAQGADLVRPGGVLVYATCTALREENEDIVAAFLHRHTDFASADAGTVLPQSAQPLVGSDGALHTFPHRHGLDGFFAVRLKRR